ncbi:MAG: hypothetical protein NTW47_06120, partial [Proteobacteria bacterium]|nr:hypothetical protein [Pseudomonadota bacterium]
ALIPYRAGDIVADGEKRGLIFLFSTSPLRFMHPAKHRMRETTAESDHNLLSQSVIPRTVDDIVIRIRCMIETSQ